MVAGEKEKGWKLCWNKEPGNSLTGTGDSGWEGREDGRMFLRLAMGELSLALLCLLLPKFRPTTTTSRQKARAIPSFSCCSHYSRGTPSVLPLFHGMACKWGGIGSGEEEPSKFLWTTTVHSLSLSLLVLFALPSCCVPRVAFTNTLPACFSLICGFSLLHAFYYDNSFMHLFTLAFALPPCPQTPVGGPFHHTHPCLPLLSPYS